MKRPLASHRPIGPFAESSPHTLSFKAMFNARAASVANMEDELADNIEDKLIKDYPNTERVRVTTRSSQITVMVDTGESGLSDSDEDELMTMMEDEIERLTQADATSTGYEFSV